MITHGATCGKKTPLYRCWINIKTRCYNPKSTRWERYGARGIRMTPEWKHSFVAFRDWALANGYKPGLIIERKDVNKNYQPDNCMWISKAAQANNKSSTRWITYQGRTQNLKQWCRELNINYKLAFQRFFRDGRSTHYVFDRAEYKGVFNG